MQELISKRFRIYGIVQGVGFRPAVCRHAGRAGVSGFVSNMGPYVEIAARGTEEQVEYFRGLIENEPPERAVILAVKEYPAGEMQDTDGFKIIESEKTKGDIYISPDIAICDECKREMFDPENRRYLHPFINCTNCGPRMTILDGLPYDRERTSMKAFPMCESCAGEYKNPGNRRFDAQPVCCNDCGPEVYLIGRSERGRDAIKYARKIIAGGGIAAVKGIGGFHLCCDALNPAAVELLRRRKNRPMKPFAVMVRDLETARRECRMSPAQEKLLCGHQKPIILLEKKKGGRVCVHCAPQNPRLGLMLPYAPLQLLLFSYDDGTEMPDCLVMTSANTSGAPICKDDESAVSELGPLCDCMLSHNRNILIRADDTVLDFYNDEPYMIRRSRGYSPLPVPVTTGGSGCVLAAGGELKNEFCIAKGDLFYMSPYVGDLEDRRTLNAFKETAARFTDLLEASPEFVVCDTHPLYNSRDAARGFGRPVLEIQHHYAHVLSCMAENDFAGKVIGISYDGTGFGDDGTIWGGELLIADTCSFTRAGHIKPFLQTGGDISAKEGWRIAAAMTGAGAASREEAVKTAERLKLCTAAEAGVLLTMADKGINTVVSTSCGRLFDAVCAVLGIRRVSTFEGEAANALMYKAMEYKGPPAALNAETFESKGRLILPTDLLFKDIVRKKNAGEDTAYLAWYFHKSLAEMTAAACIRLRAETGINTAALTGGVFQNTLLLGMCESTLKDAGFRVLRHHLIPPNDGGIALGQAYYAMNKLKNLKEAE